MDEGLERYNGGNDVFMGGYRTTDRRANNSPIRQLSKMSCSRRLVQDYRA